MTLRGEGEVGVTRREHWLESMKNTERQCNANSLSLLYAGTLSVAGAGTSTLGDR